MFVSENISPSSAIQTEKLTKTYIGKQNTQALKGIDISIKPGKLFGLLGPNGAGKSTFINILAGLVLKTEGQAFVWGADIDKNTRMARAAIGVVPQELNIDAFFTPREMLEFQAGLYGVPKNERFTDDILAAMHLTNQADHYSRALSGGMRRRLLIAKAMVHNPPILILDEPTAGVDVELRQELWEYIRELNRIGVTIVLTTHYIEEAEQLCEDIAIINNGTIVANDETATLIQRLDKKTLKIFFDQNIVTLPQSLSKFVVDTKTPRCLSVTYQPSLTNVEEILDAVRNSDLTITDLTTEEGDLEEIFLALTSRNNNQ